jgi:hypothetical protein
MQFHPSPGGIVPRSLSIEYLSGACMQTQVKNDLGDLAIEVGGRQAFIQHYGVILVDPTKYPSVKKDLGQ